MTFAARLSGWRPQERVYDAGSLFAMAVVVFLTSWWGIELTRDSGRIAAIWPSNAIILALMLRRGRSKWPIVGIIGLLAQIAANWKSGDAMPAAIGPPLSNTIEVLLVALPFAPRNGSRATLDLTKSATLVKFLSAATIAPAISGVLASTYLCLVARAEFWPVLITWYPADALGLLTVTPVLVAVDPQALVERTREKHFSEAILLIGVVLVALALVFWQNEYPLLFLCFPMLTFVAFRFGFQGVVYALFVTAVVALTATHYGHGPLTLAHRPMREQVLILQAFLAVATLTSLQICAVLAERKRLADLLVEAKDAAERAELERRHGEERYRFLTENASDVIVQILKDGTITYISPSIERLAGYSVDELLGKRTPDLMHPDDVEMVVQTFRSLALRGPGARERLEYRVRHKAGRWIWIEVNPSAIFAPDGTATGFIDVVRDVSERRSFEEKLRVARVEAEEARIAAEAASTAKTEFLAAMSHEMRTPLNAIIGYADLLLEDGALDERQRQGLGRIETSGAALLTVVNDVLDFSKVEAGEIDIRTVPFVVAGLLEGCMSIVQGAADKKGLDLHLDLEATVPVSLVGDESRLRQVLLNLLNNAVKFTRRGSVRVHIGQVGSDNSGACRVRFQVSDTGIGIPIAKMDRLFQRFSQVDSSVSREYGGTGLGLAISRRLVEAMNGIIGVDSVDGVGSTFWFEVPLVPVETSTPAIVPPRADVDVRLDLQILLAEDVEINRDIASAVLLSMGCIVDCVEDGRAAFEAVRSKTYDLVLLDVQMPVMDGIAAAREIRKLKPPKGDVPIVAMTANVLPQQVHQCLAAGMNDTIGKPFKRADLLRTLSRWGHAANADAAS